MLSQQYFRGYDPVMTLTRSKVKGHVMMQNYPIMIYMAYM